MKTYMQMMKERMASFMEWKKQFDALSPKAKNELVEVQELTQKSYERGRLLEANTPKAQPKKAELLPIDKSKVKKGLPEKWSDVTQEDKDEALKDSLKNFGKNAKDYATERAPMMDYKPMHVQGGKPWTPMGGGSTFAPMAPPYSPEE